MKIAVLDAATLGDDLNLELFRQFGAKKVTAIPDVEEAFDEALREQGDGILFCVGSLYLVGNIKSILETRRSAHD